MVVLRDSLDTNHRYFATFGYLHEMADEPDAVRTLRLRDWRRMNRNVDTFSENPCGLAPGEKSPNSRGEYCAMLGGATKEPQSREART